MAKIFKFATGDLISYDWPFWIHLGRSIRIFNFSDPFHFPTVFGFPILMSWYPLHLITAFIGSFMRLDSAFVLYVLNHLAHYLLACVFCFLYFQSFGVVAALFGAIALAFASTFLKLHAYFSYSLAWFCFCLWQHDSMLMIPGIVLILAGGNLPFFVYTIPILFFLNPLYTIFGIIGCIPQLFVTYKFLKKTVRKKATYEEKSIGSIPPWHFLSLIFPMKVSLNGVLYNEIAYFVGRPVMLSCLFAGSSYWWIALLASSFLMMGKYVKAPILARCPNRLAYVQTIALVHLAVIGISTLPHKFQVVLLILQAMEIIFVCSKFMFPHPFLEHAQKPSKAFKTPLTEHLNANLGHYRVSGLPFPLMTGHVNGFRTVGYCGGSMLAEDAEYRNIPNNGDGNAHDWFYCSEDSHKVDDYGIKYAYMPFRDLDENKWEKTKLKYLWRNKNIHD